MVEMIKHPQKKIQIELAYHHSAFQVFLAIFSLRLSRHGQFGLPRVHFLDCVCNDFTSLDENLYKSLALLEEFCCSEGFSLS